MNKILVLDNYDSFTYNLVYLLRVEKIPHEVIRNDKISPEAAAQYSGIILSPGPGIPEEAGNMPEIIRYCAGKIPILGICLGHQAIAEYAGGTLNNLSKVYHGIQTKIFQISDSPVLETMLPQFDAGRYHSWAVDKTSLPPTLKVTAEDETGCIMALEHTDYPLYGLQFHPESILTPQGNILIYNFIKICKTYKNAKYTRTSV